MPTGAELFARALKHLGLTQIFTLVGDHLNDALAAVDAAGIGVLDMRHEAAVAHAADAWARLHRRPALSLVTGGPGHTNSITGIATAQLAASPLIAVSGSRATTLGERQAFQDIDQIGTVRAVTKWSAQPPNAAQIPFYLARAFSEANDGRRGAVHLTIPVDLFGAQAPEPAVLPGISEIAPAGPDGHDVARVLAALASAERPVVIAGSGVWWSGAESALTQFIERTSLPLYTITMAKGVVSDEHPLCLGYADPALNRAVRTAFQEADLFLVLGKRIDYRLALGGSRLFPPGARFVQVDIHAQELGLNRALEVAVCADVKATLEALCAAAPARPLVSVAWIERLRTLRREWQEQLGAIASDTASPLHPAAFHAELRKALPRDTLFAWDGGDFAHWGRATIPAIAPGRWLRLGPLGTIGSSLPNGLAMQLMNPGKPVAVITGDGSLGFYLAEMDTAVRHKLPIVIIVGNDAGWGLERELQAATLPGPGTVACELRATRYDVIMQGFGGGGETIDTLEQVRPAVERAFASGVPYCLNVNIRGVRSPFTEWQIGGKAASK